MNIDLVDIGHLDAYTQVVQSSENSTRFGAGKIWCCVLQQ